MKFSIILMQHSICVLDIKEMKIEAAIQRTGLKRKEEVKLCVCSVVDSVLQSSCTLAKWKELVRSTTVPVPISASGPRCM